MATNSYGWASPQYGNVQSKTLSDNAAMMSQFSGGRSNQPNIGGQGFQNFNQPYNPGIQNRGMAMGPNGMPNVSGIIDPGGPKNPFPGGPMAGGAAPANFVPPGGSSMLDRWSGKYGPDSPVDYSNEGHRNMAEGYANYFAIPYLNAQLAERTQASNEYFGGWDRNEQGRVNTSQIDLANRASGREDEALRFGKETNVRDFGEGQRQFDAQQQLDRMWKTGQLSAQEYANQTARMQAQFQNTNTQFSNQTDRTNVNNQFTLGQGQLSNDKMKIGNDFTLGQGQLTNDRTKIGNDYALGQEQNRIRDYEAATGRIDVEGRQRLQDFANQTDRTKVSNDFTLGQGALGFQNRELDVNEAYRRSALAQEADLTREKYGNDLMQTRYQTFGRASAPNFRAAQSWS